MKIFPESDYSIELNNDSSSAILKLKNETLSKEQFITNWNSQTFIGEVKENEFELKISKKVAGEFCVLFGKLNFQKVTVEIRVGKIFKAIFIVLNLFILSGIITAIIQSKLELIIHFVLIMFVIRFIFLELGFRFFSKYALKKLTEIIGIKKIE